MVEHLLHIVQGKSTKDGETTVQPDVLGEHQSAGSGSRDDHGSETRKRDDGDTSEKRTTEVHVLVSLCGSTDKSKRAHHSSSVQSSASENSGMHEEEGRQEEGLSAIESGPEGILLHVAKIGQYFRFPKSMLIDGYLLARVCCHSAIHSSNATNKSNAQHQPRVRAHEPETPAIHMQGARSNTDDSNTKASVQERVVEVLALKWRHAAIFPSFAVEDKVDA